MQALEGVSPPGLLSVAVRFTPCTAATHAYAVHALGTHLPLRDRTPRDRQIPFKRGTPFRGGQPRRSAQLRSGRGVPVLTSPGPFLPRREKLEAPRKATPRSVLAPPLPTSPGARGGGAGRAPPGTPPANGLPIGRWGQCSSGRARLPPDFPPAGPARYLLCL